MTAEWPADDRPSLHFSWREFACRDRTRTPYPLDWRDRGRALAVELERIRLRIGPFRPTSVYRTWSHHAGIYRSMTPPQTPPAGSQHLAGRAADVPCRPDLPWDAFTRAILEVAHQPDSRLRYVKFYRRQRFAHVDIRPTAALQVEYAT